MAIDAALGRLGIKPGVCTSSTRPANPFKGQVIYETDTNNIRFWSGSAWESNKGGIVSSSAPTGAAAGDIWYDSDDGRAYIYYDDGSSQQWVEFGAAPSGSSITLASYADSAARTTAIPSPTEADLSYLQDTNSVEVYDGSAWAAVAGGKILQVVEGSTTTPVTIATTTLTSIGLSASITPTSATSKVLVVTMTQVNHSRSAASIARGYRLNRDGSPLVTYQAGSGGTNPFRQLVAAGTTSLTDNTRDVYVYLDSPATTSSMTYDVDADINSTNYSQTSTYQNNNDPSKIYLLEVSA